MTRVGVQHTKHLLFASFLTFSLALSGCDKITELKDSLFSSSEEKSSSSDKPSKKKNLKKDKNKKKKVLDAKTSGSTEIILTKKNQQDDKQLKKVDLKSAVAPTFKIDAPVNVLKRVGGSPTKVFSDSHYVYLNYPQFLGVFSKSLNLIAKAKLAYPAQDVTRVVVNDKTYVYVSEENNVLEIFEMLPSGEGQRLKLKNLASFDVGGPISWLNPTQLLVFLPTKTQLLDFANLGDIKIVKEIPIGGVSDKLILKDYIYLARGEFLDILDVKSYNLSASLRIGQKYRFLEAIEEADEKKLFLAHVNEKSHATGVQHLILTPNLSGVIDLGPVQNFKMPLDALSFDLKQGLLAGTEVTPFSGGQTTKAYLYSTSQKRFLKGPLSDESATISLAFGNRTLYVIHEDEVTSYQVKVNKDVVHKMEQSSPVTGKKPLAQIGTNQTLKDEYSLRRAQSLRVSSDSQKVFLFDKNHVALWEKVAGEKFAFKTSENFAEEEFDLKTMPHDRPTLPNRFLSTGFGLVAAHEDGQVAYLDVFFKGFKNLPLKLKNLKSWTMYRKDDRFVLVAISQNPIQWRRFKMKAKRGFNWVAEIFELESPEKINLVAQIPLKDPSWVAHLNYNLIGIVEQKRIEYYSLRDLPKPLLLKEEGQDLPINGILQDVKISPRKNRLYNLTKTANGLQVEVLDLDNPQNHITLKDFNITESQFAGSTFSMGGQLFVLPTQEGTLFYDLTNLQSVKEDDILKAHWPLPSEWADVANRGQFICVALGKPGVYCGDLLFY